MSLVTRCPACSTTFKVVEDQLRVSAGWVRCGRCGEVFNALEGLYDSGPDATGATVEPPASAAVGQVRAELIRHAPPPARAPQPEEASGLQPVRRDGQPLVQPPAVPAPAATPAVAAAPAPRPPPAEPPEPSGWALPTVVPATWTGMTTTPPRDSGIDSSSADSGLDEGLDPQAPDFLRRAERSARWHRPAVRAVLSLLLLLLVGLAGLQLAVMQRDWLATRWPQSRPTLLALCEVAGCTVQPLRRIQHMAVESSGLTRVEGAPLYKLQLVLRNTGELPLLVPALELSLTDAQGQLVSRRVVRAREMGARQDTLAAGQELSLQTLLAGSERRLAGYSVDLFYP